MGSSPRIVAVLEDLEDPSTCREIGRRYRIPVFPSFADAVAPQRPAATA